jgi:hypothetical protein
VALLQKVADVSFEAGDQGRDRDPQSDVTSDVSGEDKKPPSAHAGEEEVEQASKKMCTYSGASAATSGDSQGNVPLDYIDRCTQVERLKHRLSKVLPYIPMTESESGMAKWRTIAEFYGLAPDFPHQQLLAHSERMKTITYVTPPVRLVLDACRQDGQTLNVVSAGLRMFEEKACEHMTCVYRLCLEGLPILLPYMRKRVVSVPHETMQKFLEKGEISTEDLNLGQEALAELVSGSFALQTPPGDSDRHHVVVVAWKGKTSVKLWIDQEEASSLLERMQSAAA